jgi:hypothetical protein
MAYFVNSGASSLRQGRSAQDRVCSALGYGQTWVG